MRHLRNAAIELCKDLKDNGLNGVRFYEAQASPLTDPRDDDMGKEAAEAWDRDYCLVELGADTEIDAFGIDNPYAKCEFDHSTFESDLREKFVEHFGEEAIAYMENHSGKNWAINLQGCCETEIYRRNSVWEDFEGNKHDKPFDPLNNPKCDQ